MTASLAADPVSADSPHEDHVDLGLRGKNVLVTGASQGIGLATATMLAREGASVAICGRTAASLDEAVELIRSSTGSVVMPTLADVAHLEDIVRMIESVRATLGTIDVLVVNPGHPPRRSSTSSPSPIRLPARFRTARALGRENVSTGGARHGRTRVGSSGDGYDLAGSRTEP